MAYMSDMGRLDGSWHIEAEARLTIIDFLPRCLGPLPDGAAEYCSEYMAACGIKALDPRVEPSQLPYSRSMALRCFK